MLKPFRTITCHGVRPLSFAEFILRCSLTARQSSFAASGAHVRCCCRCVVAIAGIQQVGWGGTLRQKLHPFIIPLGFFHGLLAVDENYEVTRKISDYCTPDCNARVRWKDSDLAATGHLKWARMRYLSHKGWQLPLVVRMDGPFEYDGYSLASLTAF